MLDRQEELRVYLVSAIEENTKRKIKETLSIYSMSKNPSIRPVFHIAAGRSMIADESHYAFIFSNRGNNRQNNLFYTETG